MADRFPSPSSGEDNCFRDYGTEAQWRELDGNPELEPHECQSCGGTGDALSEDGAYTVACRECGGTGNKPECPNCNGTGIFNGSKCKCCGNDL